MRWSTAFRNVRFGEYCFSSASSYTSLMFMCRLFIALKPASDDSEIGSFMSLNVVRPVFTFEMIEEPSSLMM